MATRWVKIKDADVVNIWECNECNESATVSPDFYEENGTPICMCGHDMEYKYTEIKPSKQLIKRIENRK